MHLYQFFTTAHKNLTKKRCQRTATSYTDYRSVRVNYRGTEKEASPMYYLGNTHLGNPAQYLSFALFYNITPVYRNHIMVTIYRSDGISKRLATGLPRTV